MSENTPPEAPADNSPADNSAADRDEIAEWLAEADAAAKAEDWEKTIALYRKAQAVDRIREGVEAKLQWALRMRDIEKLYQDGKARLAAGENEAALAPLRKARVMYASHYKDVDELIVQAQTALQQQKWDERPDEAKSPGGGKRSPLFIIGVIGVVLLGALMLAFLYLQGNPGSSALPELSPTIPQVTGAVRRTASGLLIVQVQPGTGKEAQAGTMVSAHYTGYLTDGTKFDSSVGGDPIVFPLGTGSVIPGWDEGLQGMRVGEKRRLIIPPELGYGERGAGGVIPPNATLVFDVELMDVQ
jgi:hypothetical protein